MIRSKKMAIISLFIVFIIGLFCGILVERLYLQQSHHDGKRKRPSLLEKFTTELNLNTSQEAQLKSMLESIKTKHEELHKEQETVYDSLRIDFDDHFTAILDSTQKVRFKEMQEEWKRRHEKQKDNDKK